MKSKSTAKAVGNVFIKSIMAGMMIGIGGTVYLSCDNKFVGSFLFGLGLFIIIFHSYWLYTGKIGYVSSRKDVLKVLVTWIGNFVGSITVPILLYFTRFGDGLTEKAKVICDFKLNDRYVSLLVLGIFCGMLMFIAVDGAKYAGDTLAKVVIIFIPIMVFILSGFEHCVANMYYLAMARAWNIESLINILVVTAGNSIGGISMNFINHRLFINT